MKRWAWLLVSVLVLQGTACGDDDDGASARLENAVARIRVSQCACLGSQWKQICQEDAQARYTGSNYCLGAALDEYGAQHPDVVDCYIDGYEETAVCWEQASCSLLDQARCSARTPQARCDMPTEMRQFMDSCGPLWICASDGSAVPPESRCDGVEHCADGSDEAGCQ